LRRWTASTSAVDLDTESGRAFFQERLAFFNKVGFFISGGFFLASLLLAPYMPPGDYTVGIGLHAATLLLMLSAWQLCRRSLRLSSALLKTIDAGVVVGVCLGSALQILAASPEQAEKLKSSLLLVLMTVLVARAIFVPSPPLRTAVVSLASILPALAVNQLVPPPAAEAGFAWFDRIFAALWGLAAAVVATLSSGVIYGLRREVSEASRLGQYTLEEKLGEGGMGTVYRARHAMLRRPTAIKLLPPDKAGEVALRRFEREVQLTARLSHPNTVSIFDYGRTPDGIFYYAMEYLDGVNLDTLVREDGPQPPGRVAHILSQVASALVEAHGVGLIHRDVKPENVILCERGGVPDVAKVVDFGLVKDLERNEGATLTRSDMIQGTPLYLAPEAITAPDAVDPRSDLYALGAVGYFLLTGSHVFGGRTLVEVCSHHLHTPPLAPSRRLGRPLPAKLESLVLRCLSKEPAGRPQSAAELRAELAACEEGAHWGEQQAREWWRRRVRVSHSATPTGESLTKAPTLAISLEDRGVFARPPNGV